MEANQYITDFYSKFDEDSRLTSKPGLVEFLTTMRYIEKYIKPGDRVLEIGAATGRYSHALARMGYAVDAVELVEHHIEVFKQNTQPNENITITQGNAMDLSAFSDNKYDITLLLGPMYHLFNQEDKQQAIRETIRVTKPGGVMFAAYAISDLHLLDEGFRRGKINIANCIDKGQIDPLTFAVVTKPHELLVELVRKEHIDNLMSVFPVTRLHYVASNGYAGFMREALDEMDNDTFELFLKFHFTICEREDLVGITGHALDIFRK